MTHSVKRSWIVRQRDSISKFSIWGWRFFLTACTIVVVGVVLHVYVPTRNDPRYAPKSDFGLVPVNSFVSHTQTGVDVIFVHGLGSNPDSTWLMQDHNLPGNTSVNWITDLFHEDLKDHPDLQLSTRVFFYNYESYWRRDSVKGERLKRLGDEFSRHLEEEMTPNRKIILVGHSYGGLVIKEALIHSRLRQTEAGKPSIIEQTHAVVFLGTPHRGSRSAKAGTYFAALTAIYGLGSNQNMVGELQPESANLFDLHNNFVAVSGSMRIVNFFEKREQVVANVLKELVVDEQSAVMHAPNSEAWGLNRNHIELNKFAKRDSDYKILTKKLRDLMKAALQTADDVKSGTRCRERQWMVPFGRNRDFIGREPEMAQVLDKIPPGSDEDDCQRTAIWGLCGIGKTQIALEAAFRFREKHQDCDVYWVPAVDSSTFENAYRDIGRKLQIEGIEEDKADVKSLVKSALSRSAGHWLLILDNVDDIEIPSDEGAAGWLQDYLPFSLKGSILITTRNREVLTKLDVHPNNSVHAAEMEEQDLFQLLAKHSGQDLSSDASGVEWLLDELAHHTLAVRNAALYMNQTATNATGYMELYKEEKLELLSKPFGDKGRYSIVDSAVVTAILISIKQISRHNQLAAEYLGMMSLLSKNGIPEAILPRRGSELKSREAISLLTAHKFITQQVDQTSYDMHSLVRLTTRKWLTKEGKLNHCATLVIRQLDGVFPFPNHDNKATWLEFLPHALKALKFQDDVLDAVAKSRLLLHVGESHSVLGKYQDAVKLFNRSLELRKQELGEDHPDTLTTMHSFGNALASLGRLEEAERRLFDTVWQRKKVLGPGDAATLGAMHDHASVLYRRGKFKEAEDLLQKTCELQAQNPVLGPGHADTLRCRSNAALMVYSQGDYAEAENLLREVVGQQTDLLGPNHPDTLRSTGSLARAEYRQGKHVKAEDRLRDTMERQSDVLGETHPDTLRSKSSLGRAAYRLGDYSAAGAMFREAIKWQKSVLGPENCDTLRSICGLARTYYRQGRYKEAEDLFRRTVELRTLTFNAIHPDTLGAMNGLARALYRRGEYEESKELFERCTKMQMEHVGPNHHDTLCSQNGLALVRQKLEWVPYFKAFLWRNDDMDNKHCA